MNKFFIGSIGIICLVLNLTSCNNDLPTPEMDVSSQISVGTKSTVVSNDTIYKNDKFIYEGEIYEYTSTFVNDSIVNIDNETVKKLFREFENNSNLVTHMYRDGSIELFKNNETFHAELSRVLEKEQMLMENEIIPYKADVPWKTVPPIDRTENKMANLYLCDDEHYEDTYRQFDLTPENSPLEVPKLKSHDINDKTTSFAAYTIGGTTLFELFEDSNFKDDCITFVVSTGSVTEISGDVSHKWGWPAMQIGQLLVADLKDLWVTGHKVDTWNDRISSVRITRL